MEIELEHVIGFTGRFSNTLKFHPIESNIFVYPVGGVCVIADLNDPHEQTFLHGHDEDISSLALSTSGRFIATGQMGSSTVKGHEAKVIVWDSVSKKELYRLHGHTGQINSVSFSGDEKFLVSVDSNGKLYVWSLETGEVVCGLREPDKACNTITWAHEAVDNGRGRKSSYFLVGGFETSAKLYKLEFILKSLQFQITQEAFHIPSTGLVRNFTNAVIDKEDRYIYMGSSSGDICAFNLQTKVYRNGTQITSNGITSMAEGPAGILYIGSGDGKLKKVRVNGHAVTEEKCIKLTGQVTSISPSADGAELLVGTSGGAIYRVLSSDLTHTLASSGVIGKLTSASFGSSSEQFLTTTADGDVVCWDLSSYSIIWRAFKRGSSALSSSLSKDGNSALVGWEDGSVTGYHARTGASLWEIPKAHRGAVTSIVATPMYIASGGDDGCVRVWSSKTRELVVQFQEHKKAVVRILPDNVKTNLLHTVSLDQSVLTFDLKTERRVTFHLIADGKLTDMTQRRDSEQELITVGTNGVILQWDCDFPDPVKVLKDASLTRPDRSLYRLNSIAIHPKHSLLAVAGDQQVVKLWDLTTDKIIGEFAVHSRTITDLSWSPDGKQLISVGNDRCIAIWNFYD